MGPISPIRPIKSAVFFRTHGLSALTEPSFAHSVWGQAAPAVVSFSLNTLSLEPHQLGCDRSLWPAATGNHEYLPVSKEQEMEQIIAVSSGPHGHGQDHDRDQAHHPPKGAPHATPRVAAARGECAQNDPHDTGGQ